MLKLIFLCFFSFFYLAGIPVLRKYIPKSLFIFYQIQRAWNRHSSQVQADLVFALLFIAVTNVLI